MASKKQANRYWFVKEYWDRPEPKAIGDTDIKKLYQAVGSALTAWETAEQNLASLFILMMECVNSKSELAARRAYGSIDSNSGRRKAIEAVAEVYFLKSWRLPEIKKPTMELIDEIGNASRRRDDIAHARVWTIQVGQKNYGSFLFPVEYNNSRSSAFVDPNDSFGFMRADFRYTHEDILMFAAKFGVLDFAIHQYVILIQNKDHYLPLIKRGRPVPPTPTSKAD